MTDIHEPKVRSYNMSQIKAQDTKPEMIVRRYLFSKGYRYRTHNKRLPGKPDIVMKKHNIVIFVNGCFWHGHKGCSNFRLPKAEWWKSKIQKNKERDKINFPKLKKLGWRILTIWECELNPPNRNDTLQNLVSNIEQLRGNQANKNEAIRENVTSTTTAG